MSGQGLTEEQKLKIQENKLRALARRIEKQSPVKHSDYSSSSQLTPGAVGVALYPPNNSNTNTNTNFVSVNRDVNKGISTFSQTNNKFPNTAVLSFGKDTFSKKNENGVVSNLRGKCVYMGKDTFSVEVGYSASLIQYFKQLKTRQFDASTKVWSFKMEEYNTFIKGVQNFRPEIEIESLPRWILQNFASTNRTNANVLPTVDLSCVDEKLVTALLPFQQDGVKCAIQHNGRLLIADDMGLGKTLQAICVACYYREEWPLLIVSPSSVRFDWAQQICRWLPSVAPCDINVVETSKSSFTSGIINILSYDLLSKRVEELKKQKFKIIIMDESHFLKNAKTVRTKAAMPLLKIAKRVLLLSGTPALSRPSELYSQITAVCPDLFKFHEFGLRYCGAKEMQWGWDYTSSSNMVELQALLEEKIMIRREKKDVLSQLPSKYRQVTMLDPSSIHKHKDLKSASKIMSNVKLKGMNKRGALLEYFHETCKAKLLAVRGYVLDLIESDKKFLVFAHHKEMLDCVEDGIKSEASHVQYIRIDGRTTSEQRHFLCSKFQACDSYKVAILSITAANAGLNLSAANIVVFAELFWNPGILVQAEDRVHRIGQKDSVNIQYLVAQHTADDYIWPLVQGKLDTLSKAGLAKDDFADADTKRLTDNTQQTLLDMFSHEFIDNTVPDIPPADVEMPLDISVNVAGLSPEKIDVNVRSLSPLSIDINVRSVSPHNVDINVVPEAKTPVKSRSPRKCAAGNWTRKIASKQKLMSSQSSGMTQLEKTPSKRQVSITSFFDRTPPKKMRLDVDTVSTTQQSAGFEVAAREKESNNAYATTQQPEHHVNIASKSSDQTGSLNMSTYDPGSVVCTLMPWLDEDLTSQSCDESVGSSSTRNDESANKSSQEIITGSADSSSTVTCERSARDGSQDDLTWLEGLDWDDEM